MAYPGKRAVEVKDHVSGFRARGKARQKLDLQLIPGDWHGRQSRGFTEKKQAYAAKQS